MNAETQLQLAIQRALCWIPRVKVWRCNTGAKKGGRLKFGLRDLDNQVKGTPDLIGIADGRPLAIEVKLPGEKAKPHQDAWLADWRAHGGIGLVVHSVSEAVTKAQDAARLPPYLRR
jgi:hypothetical protein